MNGAPLGLYAVAAVAAIAAAALLLQLRGALSAPQSYARRIAGVMFAAFALILAGFATVAWRAAQSS